MDILHLQERYQQLLDEEKALLDALYDLDMEEMDYFYHDGIPEKIKEAKRITGEKLDAWWDHNKVEYRALREQLNGG